MLFVLTEDITFEINKLMLFVLTEDIAFDINKLMLFDINNMLLFVLTEDITFDHAPSPQHPAIYSDTIIECRVSGQPVPKVTWRYRGQKINVGKSCYILVL